MAARGVSRGPVARPQPARPTPVMHSEYDAPLVLPKKSVLGISSRLIDVVLVVWLVFFAVAAGFTGGLRVTAALNGISITALKKWPPADLVKLFFLWGSKVDATLLQDDQWLTSVAFMQSFILAPAALVIAYGILAGHSWVKTPALVWTGAVVYSAVLCVLHASISANASAAASAGEDSAGEASVGSESDTGPEPLSAAASALRQFALPSAMLLGVYQLFVVLPLLLALRLHRSRFSRALHPFAAFILHAVAGASWAIFWSYVLKFVVLYRPSLLPADLLALVNKALRSLP